MLYVNENNEPITEENIEPDWNIWTTEYIEESEKYDIIRHCRRLTDKEINIRKEMELQGIRSAQMNTALQFFVAQAELTDAQALQVSTFYSEWDGDNVDYKEGERRRYLTNLYRCKQNHTSQKHQTPDLIPAIWYLVPPEEETGTIDNPIRIPDNFSSMVYTKGKYYIEDGVIYLMNRDGMKEGEEIFLTFKPSQLVGQYFEIAA